MLIRDFFDLRLKFVVQLVKEAINSVDIQIVFEPEWTKEMMTEEAKLELGFL